MRNPSPGDHIGVTVASDTDFAAYAAAFAAHPTTPTGPNLRHTTAANRPGLRLSGETDITNRLAWEAILDSAIAAARHRGATIDVPALQTRIFGLVETVA